MQNVISFDPQRIINQEIVCITRAKKLIQKFLDLNILASYNAKQEYELFIQTEVLQNIYHFSSIDKDKQRLDTFLGKYNRGYADYVHLWRVCKVVFI